MRRLALLAAVAALSACNQQPEKAPNATLDIEGVAEPGTTPVAPDAPASVDGAPPSPGQPPAGDTAEDFARPLRLTGTEPFWGIQIGEKITLQRPDHPEVVVTNAGPTVNGDVAVWNARGLTIRLEKGVCSDGMSDNRYPYQATVTVDGGEMLKGCGIPASQWPPKPPA
ncbi:MAG TPA: hypothetical protein VF138_06480 [Caulobacteraceae bacterium]